MKSRTRREVVCSVKKLGGEYFCSAVWANIEQGKYFRDVENGVLNPNVTNYFSTYLRTAIRIHISELVYLCHDIDLILLSSISVSL
jgi:hypothetical protein